MKCSERIRTITRQLILVRLFKFELNIPIIKPMSMIYFVNTSLSLLIFANICSGRAFIRDRHRQLCECRKPPINELQRGDTASSARHVTIEDYTGQISRVTEAENELRLNNTKRKKGII